MVEYTLIGWRLGECCQGSKGGGRSLYAKLPNKGVMVPPFGGFEVIILELFHPILWLILLAYSDKAELSFFYKERLLSGTTVLAH